MYKKNEDFFDVWSRPMAYTLGFITADGYVNQKKACLEITIHPKDIEILEYIRSYLAPEIPIKVYQARDLVRNKVYDRARYNVSSRRIVDCLAFKHGITQAKSSKDIVPNIPKEFFGDYVRGVFDGDGNVGKDSGHPLFCCITSNSKIFLESLRSTMNGIGILYYDHVWRWRMSASDSFKLREVMYNNEEFALKRKKDRFFIINPEDLLVSKYYPEDDLILKNMLDLENIKNSLEKASVLLGRSYGGLKNRAVRLKLYEPTPNWTLEQESIVKNEFDPKNPGESCRQLAEKLNKSFSSIHHKVTRLNLRSCYKKRKVT